jgi:short-subunit dehydrogenase
MIERFDRTGKKSAILVTTSGLGLFPCAGMLAYSSCKSFANNLAEGLNFELKDKIDVISYQAGMVNTKLLNMPN